MASVLTILVYDVSSDRQRDRLYTLLKQYGVPVQKSVFEARLTLSERRRIIERARPLLNPETDRFVLYTLPASHEDKIVSLGKERQPLIAQKFWIV